MRAAASAADIPVLPGGSIQSATDAAVDGDRVVVSPGTYIEQIDFLGKAIEVVGLGGASQTVLDGNGLGPVVRFFGAEGPSSRLRGVTVTGGFASMGAGGIVCGTGATPVIEDCIVQGNRGKFGGGVSGSPTMRRCSILDNTASLIHGGGVYGAPQLTLCVVARNTATSATGGGLYLVGGAAVLDRCMIIENSAVFANSRGGGVYVDSTATLTMTGCVVADNFSTGGAFPFQSLYTRANTVAASWSQPGWPEISTELGGHQVLRTLAGSSYDGALFLVLGSLSGTSPGFALLGVTVPLNPDAYLLTTIAAPNSPPLDNSLGILDFEGRAETSFTLPAGAPAGLGGLTAHHAVLALDLVTPQATFISNAEGVEILQ